MTSDTTLDAIQSSSKQAVIIIYLGSTCVFVCVRRIRPFTRRRPRPTTRAVSLCQGGDVSECIAVNRFTDEQNIRPVTASTNPSNFSSRFRTSTAPRTRSLPGWISGSGRPTSVAAVAFDRRGTVMYGSGEGEVKMSRESAELEELYQDGEGGGGAEMARVAAVVRHLGLAVGVGACALAVGVVAAVTTIACRYRAAAAVGGAGTALHGGYRRAATDDKLAVCARNEAGMAAARNGYKQMGGGDGYGRSYGGDGGGGRWADVPGGGGDSAAAAAARASLIRCDGDGDAFVTSSITMTSSSSRRGHVTEWFV